MPNSLTRHVSLKAGPWFLETLVKHYFDRLRFSESEKERERKGSGGDEATDVGLDESGKLRRDEFLYDEVFHIVKSFLDVSTHHTIEELQQFSNTRTPSSPWMYVMRVRIPMSCCDDAARHLIDVLGGEEKTRQVVGGTKWWQVRGIRGVDAQWIVARKDYQRIKKQRKQHQQQAEQSRRDASMNGEEDAAYDPEMDELRCILYCHGGGYYFGSVDQERYFLQRFARKSGCRLLAISYRLAPQYPFPCAIQDALASYLYLIQPPADAPHTPVNAAHIIIAGDSAGGGLILALLQVIRDSGLPLPAGAIPISPWCDLTHSFPSIHLNTETDVIPKYGLSVYKPSVLWPPPSDELTDEMQAGIRNKIKQIARQYRKGKEVDERANKEEEQPEAPERPPKRPSSWKRRFTFGNKDKKRERSISRGRNSTRNASRERETLAEDAKTGDVRAAAVTRSLSRQPKPDGAAQTPTEKDLLAGPAGPLPTADDTSLRVVAEDGEALEVRGQVHMYAPNNLLVHPLVSPAMSYLGGLPPMLIIASDAEVLRDEIIYTAHKAAHPDRYPVKPEARKLYPKLEGIEERYGPTKVHLQVYDHAAHTFPVLFFVCSSSKFCFRAMANFSKYVLGTLPIPASVVPSASPSSSSNETPSLSRRRTFKRSPSLNLSIPRRLSMMGHRKRRLSLEQRTSESQQQQQQQQPNGDARMVEPSAQVTGSPGRTSLVSSRSSRSERVNSSVVIAEGVRLAGDPSVYLRHPDGSSSPFIDNMIRERVSTTGEIRPLDSELELPACTMPIERIGVAGELVLRRYIEGATKWNERFAKTKETIRKRRAHSLKLARSDAARIFPRLEMYFFLNANEELAEGGMGEPSTSGGQFSIKGGLERTAASWGLAWALDGNEKPPPSSIVARRDTEEARRLSRIADFPADMHDHRVSGNNLWSYLVNRLSLEKNEARVEQMSVEKDPNGIGKDASFDALDLQGKGKSKKDVKGKGKEEPEKQKEGSRSKERDVLKERKHKPRWPRSFSRGARGATRSRDHSREKRGSIFRLKSTSVVRPRSGSTPVQVDGGNAETTHPGDTGRI